MAFVRALGLGDGLGALAAAWELLGGGVAAAPAELRLRLLLLLLLPGVLFIPLLEHRADGRGWDGAERAAASAGPALHPPHCHRRAGQCLL